VSIFFAHVAYCTGPRVLTERKGMLRANFIGRKRFIILAVFKNAVNLNARLVVKRAPTTAHEAEREYYYRKKRAQSKIRLLAIGRKLCAGSSTLSSMNSLFVIPI